MYEITYKFRKETAPGTYSEETETKTVKVGNPGEDTPLDLAAGKIMAQMAKRSILVVEVEVYEYTKKKLNVKLTDEGIVLKNKKFTFDEGAMVSTACDTDIGATAEQLVALLQSNPQLLQAVQPQMSQPQGMAPPLPGMPQVPGMPVNPQQQMQQMLRPQFPGGVKRYEVFEPELPNLMEAKKAGLKFTLGNKYPVHSERMTGIPPVTNTLYTMTDDSGAKVEVSAKYFSTAPMRTKLAYEDEMKGGQDTSGEPRLMWGDSMNEPDMPNIRG